MYDNKQGNHFRITEYLIRHEVYHNEMQTHHECHNMCNLYKAFGLYFKIIELPS